MNRRIASIARITSLTFAASLVASTLAADERPEVGGVERLQQGATASYETQERKLAVKDAILFHDLVETSQQARLAIVLKDGTELTLGENASLRIDEFVYQPDQGNGKLGLEVLEGAFLFVGGDTENVENSKVEIDTAVGTLGVRGTTVWGGRIDGSFGVLVTEGEVTVRNSAGEVNLGAGEGTMIDAMDAEPSAPKRWPDEKVQRALKTISFKSD